MKKTTYITVKLLKELGACPEGVAEFLKLYPSGRMHIKHIDSYPHKEDVEWFIDESFNLDAELLAKHLFYKKLLDLEEKYLATGQYLHWYELTTGIFKRAMEYKTPYAAFKSMKEVYKQCTT